MPTLPTESYDVVIFNGTPGGIACALRAAREGLRVLLVNHTMHVGGFLSSGAGGWETPCDYLRSPIYAEVRNRITEHYRQTYGEGSTQHLASLPQADSRRHIDRAKVEPRVAECIFDDLLAAENRITVWKGFHPVEARLEGSSLRSVSFRDVTPTTRTVIASVFVDASYEGDLMAVAGAPYRVGREAREEYGEPHAGRLFVQHHVPTPPGQPGWPTASCDGRLNLRHFGHASGPIVLPESTGEGDACVMAYNYRLILTDNPDNRVEIARPDAYDPTVYRGLPANSIVPNLPNRKIAWNAGRLIGPQHAYPEGNRATRQRIDRAYRDFIVGQLHYLQNDPEVPAETRARWRRFGLARDEFPDNDHLPYEVYVREARRLVGRYVFTERDGLPIAEGARTPVHADSIATTDWPLDSVACTTETVDGSAMDGIMFLAEESRPAQVPYRCLLPQGVDNLLVPVCLSASHVGWGPIRLEPVWMQTGEAAGFASAQAVRQGIPPAAIDARQLVRTMAEAGCMVSFFNDIDPTGSEPWIHAIQLLGTLGFFTTYDARPHEPLGSDTDAWNARWRQLSPTAGTLDPTTSRAEAALAIYRDLAGTAGPDVSATNKPEMTS